MWTISGNEIHFDDGSTVQFPYDIQECQRIDDVLVVVLDLPRDSRMTENVFGVSLDGKIIWQIERTPEMSKDPINFYTGILKPSSRGVRLANWNGVSADVDVRTGKISDFGITK